MKVVFCGYRDWALAIFEEISKHPKISSFEIIKSNEEYKEKVASFESDVEFILFIGWSWIIPREVTEKHLCLGIHPSDLPDYRGGSPIQHQIIRGVTHTKSTLMTLSSDKLDGGHIWKKAELSLKGDTMVEIFNNLVESSITLLTDFLDEYQSITPVLPDTTQGSYFKRRKPSESRLTLNQMEEMSLQEIYNFIRSLTDPYPNAYLEDKMGNKLLFKEVKYIPNEDSE